MSVTEPLVLRLFICFYDKFFQYDLSASQFSPDGRVFQVEYAQKAVENSGYVFVIHVQGSPFITLCWDP